MQPVQMSPTHVLMLLVQLQSPRSCREVAAVSIGVHELHVRHAHASSLPSCLQNCPRPPTQSPTLPLPPLACVHHSSAALAPHRALPREAGSVCACCTTACVAPGQTLPATPASAVLRRCACGARGAVRCGRSRSIDFDGAVNLPYEPGVCVVRGSGFVVCGDVRK